MIRRLIPWSPAAFWAAFLFFLSSRTWDRAAAVVPIDDKVVHLLLYAVLGGALALGRRLTPDPPAVWRLLIIGLLYALSDEVHQLFVPGRTSDPLDLLADGVGLVLGCAGVHLLMAGRPALSNAST